MRLDEEAGREEGVLLSQFEAVASETQRGAILSGNCSAATTQPAQDDEDCQYRSVEGEEAEESAAAREPALLPLEPLGLEEAWTYRAGPRTTQSRR